SVSHASRKFSRQSSLVRRNLSGQIIPTDNKIKPRSSIIVPNTTIDTIRTKTKTKTDEIIQGEYEEEGFEESEYEEFAEEEENETDDKKRIDLVSAVHVVQSFLVTSGIAAWWKHLTPRKKCWFSILFTVFALLLLSVLAFIIYWRGPGKLLEDLQDASNYLNPTSAEGGLGNEAIETLPSLRILTNDDCDTFSCGEHGHCINTTLFKCQCQIPYIGAVCSNVLTNDDYKIISCSFSTEWKTLLISFNDGNNSTSFLRTNMDTSLVDIYPLSTSTFNSSNVMFTATDNDNNNLFILIYKTLKMCIYSLKTFSLIICLDISPYVDYVDSVLLSFEEIYIVATQNKTKKCQKQILVFSTNANFLRTILKNDCNNVFAYRLLIDWYEFLHITNVKERQIQFYTRFGDRLDNFIYNNMPNDLIEMIPTT
ncbi:unnamed protein product, partial [Didymodactylos carnosus]